MKILEIANLEDLKPKVVAKIIFGLLKSYLNMEEPLYESTYLGRISNRQF